jgi:Zn-dependent M28 family amino/carboxypeptidase
MRSNLNPARVESLKRHVDRLAGLIGPRHLGAPRSFAAAATFVERELAEAGYATARQPYRVGQHEVSNIVAELPGIRRREEIVVVGAHYDTIFYTPGADDNASAVAVLIEVARLMRPLHPSRTVRFVSFACEEPPYFHTGDMGSQVYARQCRASNEHIHGMLCLEMLGYYATEPNSQQIPPGIPRFLHRFLPHRGDFLAAVANLQSWRLLWQFRRGFKRAARFPLWTLALPESIEEIRLSDNSSFWDQGYPALMITDTSFLRNPNYHAATDTPDTLDYQRMAQVTLGIAGATARLAGIRRPRRFT